LESAIHDAYPELAVVHERPKWMTDGHFEKMQRSERYNLNDTPSGMLKAVLSDRAEKENSSRISRKQ
jgi:hypothetical protein